MTMMPELAARVTVLGTAVRAMAAFVAAAALLLQLFVMPPLAMRMLSSLTSGGWSVVLCSGGPAERSSAPAHQPQLPASPHDHDGCPLRQCHSVPLAVIAVVILILAVTTSWRWLRPVMLIIPVPSAPFRLNSSRAPPALA
jgi:hypothetical protein